MCAMRKIILGIQLIWFYKYVEQKFTADVDIKILDKFSND